MTNQNFSDLFNQLEKLSALELHRQALELVKKENETTASLIAHLSEISKKQADLELSYRGLFDYCVRGLNLSEGSAFLKMQVATVCRQYPLVLERLSENKISLTVAGLLSPHLRPENVEKLLHDCEYMSKRQVVEYLVALKPKPQVSSGIRRAVTSPSTPEGGVVTQVSSSAGTTQVENPTAKASQVNGSATSTPELFSSSSVPAIKPTSQVNPASPEVFNIRFAASKTFRDKLMRLSEVLGIERPESHLEEVLEKALDLALDRKDPQRKLERKLRRENTGADAFTPRPDEDLEIIPGSALNTAAMKKVPGVLAATPKPRSRYIPAAMRQLVLHRAGYQCEYRGPDGTRCQERTGLEVDHIQPHANGGSGDHENLRVLCWRHNLWKARRDFGVEFIRGKIAGAG